MTDEATIVAAFAGAAGAVGAMTAGEVVPAAVPDPGSTFAEEATLTAVGATVVVVAGAVVVRAVVAGAVANAASAERAVRMTTAMLARR
jgi:hypothetical protein